VSIESDDFYHDDPIEEKPKRKLCNNLLTPASVIIASIFFFQSTLAGNISLNSNSGVEFGQGITQTVSCAGSPVNLTLTPGSSFTNGSNSGAHYLKSVKVSGITSACVGVDFTLNAYDDSGSNPLAIFNSTSTDAVVYVASTSSYLAGFGSYGTTISSASGSFTVTFTAPVAISSSVAKVTVETGPHYALDGTVSCPGGGYFTIANNVVTSSSANCAGSITVPRGVTAIAGSAFYNRSSITGTVSLPSGLLTIGNGAFYGNGTFSVSIPASVTNIDGAFYRTNLSSITFQSPSSLTSLGDSTFRSTLLTSITIPDGITTLGNLVFGDSPLASSPFSSTSSLTNIGTNTLSSATFTSFVIPSGVTSIGNAVFLSLPNLAKLTIPNGVTSISATAFVSTPALSCIIYTGSNSTVLSYNYPNSAVVRSNISLCP
jgi:hypothetical protein